MESDLPLVLKKKPPFLIVSIGLLAILGIASVLCSTSITPAVVAFAVIANVFVVFFSATLCSVAENAFIAALFFFTNAAFDMLKISSRATTAGTKNAYRVRLYFEDLLAFIMMIRF